MADGDVRLITARPTIRIAGVDYPLLSANIERMAMREGPGGLSSLELTFTDWLSQPDGTAGYGATGGSPLKLGAQIKVFAGETTGPQTIFEGMITAIEGEAGVTSPPSFTILAEDALWKARRLRKSRTFDNASPADLVRAIASDCGLTPDVRDGLDKPSRTWAQMNESDLGFLRRVLEPLDADIVVVGDKLQAGPLARDDRLQNAPLVLTLGNALVKARVTADLADQATEVRVGSFDPATGEAALGSAKSGELGPGQGPMGADILQRIAGDVREHIGVRQPMTKAEADQQARAAFGRRARRFVRVEATAQGDARIRVGSWLKLAGLNPFFVNQYVVTEALHRFDVTSGYLTDFCAECAHLGTPA